MFNMWTLIMCRSPYGCVFTPISYHRLFFHWPYTLLPSYEASISNGVQGSKKHWPDQTWYIMKEKELNVIPSSANHWEQWQLGSTSYGSSFSWSFLLLSVIFFSDTVSGMSLSLWSWTLVERPFHLGGCCLMPCYSSSWSGWLVCKFVITYSDRYQNMVC